MQYVSLFEICNAEHANNYKKFQLATVSKKNYEMCVKYALHTTSMTQCILNSRALINRTTFLPAVCTQVQQ